MICTLCLGLLVCELKAIGFKCCFICDILHICGIEIVENALNEVIFEVMDVHRVNTLCQFLDRDLTVCTERYDKKQAFLFLKNYKSSNRLATKYEISFFLS